MTIRALATPWAAPGERIYCSPRDVLVTMALGEDPDDIPSLADIRRGRQIAPEKFDGGPVERIARDMAGNFKAARIHAPALSALHPSQKHVAFNTSEQVSGVARSFVLRFAAGAPIGKIALTLAQLSNVEAASPNYLAVTPFEAGAARPPALAPKSDTPDPSRAMIRAAEALRKEPGDSAILVGLVDSGVAPDHPEIKGKLRTGYDTVQLAANGVGTGVRLLDDHTQPDHKPTDHFVGHGMGCAGIIGGLGIRMQPGLGGAAQIIPLRALAAARLLGQEKAIGIGAISDLDAAVKLAVDLGAKVINMSFGTDDSALLDSSPKPHTNVVRYALDHGCILVAASGNNGKATKFWPAAFEGVIAVGACDTRGYPTGFSTRGDHVALCAPGERVLSCGLTGYSEVTGTSFAAPFVAAAAALLVAYGDRRAFPVDAHLARDILVRSAQPFSSSPVEGCGAGILDALAALNHLDALAEQAAASDRGGSDDG
jgi:subtilisin family serine protease